MQFPESRGISPQNRLGNILGIPVEKLAHNINCLRISLDVRHDQQSACNCERVFCNCHNEVRQMRLEHNKATDVISAKRPRDCTY